MTMEYGKRAYLMVPRMGEKGNALAAAQNQNSEELFS